ncbi:hypothetical protein FKM82_016016, partial [Ascaphus truei]
DGTGEGPTQAVTCLPPVNRQRAGQPGDVTLCAGRRKDPAAAAQVTREGRGVLVMSVRAVTRGLRLLQGPGNLTGARAGLHVSSRHKMRYGFWAYILGERTTKRFGEHSKIITVDGNLASGKSKLAQQLAEKMGMRYFPEPDEHYLNKVTGDGRILPSKFSGSCSLQQFYDDPTCPDGNAYRLQFWMYNVRVMQYIDALAHLLSTGQGAVLERSPFSDFVFLDAMYKNGYIRTQCECRTYCPLHVEHASEKKVSLAYLQSIQDSYKKSFLPQIR